MIRRLIVLVLLLPGFIFAADAAVLGELFAATW